MLVSGGRPIFLLGMMGAGKTSVGRLLAAGRAATFVDLDTRIELLFGASIAALFERGESHFRACERVALRSLLGEPGFAGAGVVVATGGGLVTDPANLEDIAAVGELVYLELAPARLAARLSAPEQLATRPLLEQDPVTIEQRLTSLLCAREQGYRRASVVVDADAPPDEVAARVERALLGLR
ncbi:MAG TPA: shikimate kinase [Enhygromyxa sp.]|nr:shikimate kinase [Enhygromyxa sp.]